MYYILKGHAWLLLVLASFTHGKMGGKREDLLVSLLIL